MLSVVTSESMNNINRLDKGRDVCIGTNKDDVDSNLFVFQCIVFLAFM
jgi:hypothetical protein